MGRNGDCLRLNPAPVLQLAGRQSTAIIFFSAGGFFHLQSGGGDCFEISWREGKSRAENRNHEQDPRVPGHNQRLTQRGGGWDSFETAGQCYTIAYPRGWGEGSLGNFLGQSLLKTSQSPPLGGGRVVTFISHTFIHTYIHKIKKGKKYSQHLRRRSLPSLCRSTPPRFGRPSP